MVRTEWKPRGEILFNIGDVKSVTIFSCATCANLSGTGGRAGVKYMRRLLHKWGVKVVAARIITACCPLAVMDHAIKKYRKHLQKSEAVIVLACSSGVKSTMVCDPSLKVINVLNTLGAVTVGEHSQDERAKTPCKACNQCVLTFTDGLCPAAECPLKRLYTPCKDAPGEGEGCDCAVDPDRECVWVKIRERGDPDKIAKLKLMEAAWKKENTESPPPPRRQISTPRARNRIGKPLANNWLSRTYERFVPKID